MMFEPAWESFLIKEAAAELPNVTDALTKAIEHDKVTTLCVMLQFDLKLSHDFASSQLKFSCALSCCKHTHTKLIDV